MTRDLLSAALAALGALFYLAGTVGVLRFPDAHARLHAVAKADNVGLGFVVLGLVVQAEGPAVAVKLLLVWLFALVSSAAASYQIAEVAARDAAGRTARVPHD